VTWAAILLIQAKPNEEGKLMRPVYEYDSPDGLDDVADREMEDEL
jgi:hypothetical protein